MHRTLDRPSADSRLAARARIIRGWAAVAEPGWFIPDSIHYTPQGYAQRSRLIADALARAFPLSQPALPGMTRMLSPEVTGEAVSSSPTCLVR